MQKRFLFHFHTYHSFDSKLTPEEIVRVAAENQIDVVAPCDHNTQAGAREIAEIAGDHGIETIIGAEYNSDHGDIIGLFLKEEIETRKVEELIREIHAQDGLVIVPHPYRSHKLKDEWLQHVDGVEIFNARLSKERNARATELAVELNKPVFYGCDAHLREELTLVISEFEQADGESVKSALRRGTTPVQLEQTTLAKIYKSQMIRGRKLGRNGLYLKSLIRFCQHSLSGARP